jgi:outer membrane protein
MKNYIRILFAAAFVLMVSGLSAQKLGHVDFAKLFQQMPGQDTIQTKYKQYADGLKKQLEVMQTEWETKISDYQANAAGMSAIIKQTKEKELQDLQGRIEAFQQSAQQDLQMKESELTQPLIERAKKAIQDVAKENNYQYIFNSAEGLLLYSPASEDVMPLVKKKLGMKD